MCKYPLRQCIHKLSPYFDIPRDNFKSLKVRRGEQQDIGSEKGQFMQVKHQYSFDYFNLQLYEFYCNILFKSQILLISHHPTSVLTGEPFWQQVVT